MLFRSGAFSPLLLIFWTLYWLVSLALDFYQRRTEINQKKLLTFFATAYLAVEKRKSAFLLLPIALNFPWSASLIFHPTQILLDPGLPLSGGEGTWLALLNPGGESGVPLWIVSPVIFYLITVLFSKKYVMDGVISALLLSSVIILSIFNVVGHGSDGRFWAGSVLIVIQAIIIPRAIQIASELLPNLRTSKLGLGHFISGIIALITIMSISLTSRSEEHTSELQSH